MAITCPKCGSQFDATLFQFGHQVRCRCGAEVEYPGTDLRAGHVLAQGEDKAIPHEDRCVGCLLGTACGDILGAAVEGWPASAIHQRFGKVHDFLGGDRGFGCYTDDTQMTLALASSLVECGRVDAAQVSAKYAEFYEPWRGYGGAAHMVMQALRSGADYRDTGRAHFREGSFGNGGAMRIAPIGLAYRHAAPEVLCHAVEEALLCTHVHPEAIDGAFIQAVSVARAATTTDAAKFDAKGLLQALQQQSRTAVLRLKLNELSDALTGEVGDEEVIETVGNGIRASEAVAATQWAFLRYGTKPEECIIRAVGFGGDTDTIGAMAGALVGALHGSSWIPARWRDKIENGSHGRDEIVALARRLAALDIRSLE